ncbi:Dual specificity protein phosphatase PHS1-like protein [Drosera capensis]
MFSYVVENAAVIWGCRPFLLWFGRIRLDLDKKLYGKISMEWQQRRPSMKVCPICGKNAGLSSSSLKLHLRKYHKKLSSGSVDSAMTLEIQKAISEVRMSRSGSVTPTKTHSFFLLAGLTCTNTLQLVVVFMGCRGMIPRRK